jgi:sarcosine oxidase, subunit beta
MQKTSDVIIIGGGVVGCSIAFHLAKLGCANVIILEKDAVGSGSTGKCAGGIRQQFSSEINIKLSMESVRFFEHFEEETGYPADFHQNGYLILATNINELQQFKRNVEMQQSLGLGVNLLSPREIKQIIPQLNIDDVLCGTLCLSDGYADPYSVVQGFARTARSMGVRILQETEVITVLIEEGKVVGVETNNGSFNAHNIINAAGPWAKSIGKMVGVDIPVAPHRRHIFVTEPIQEMHKDLPLVVEFRNGFWFRREGRSLIFGMRNPDAVESYDISVDWDFLSGNLAQVACHRLPFLSNIGIMSAQAGLHEDTPDTNALVGQVPNIEGFYLACGFSGHGFMHSPAIGRIMAEMIVNNNISSPDIFSLSLNRFQKERHETEKVFI